MLSLAKISKKLTSKVQRLSYATVPKGTVADIYIYILGVAEGACRTWMEGN